MVIFMRISHKNTSQNQGGTPCRGIFPRKLVSVMLMLSLVFSSVTIFPNSNLNASADSEIWSEHTAESVVSVNNVYSVDTAADLAWVAKQVNKEGNTFAGKTIKLTADIDLKDYQWIPIGLGDVINENGVATNVFQGNFNGQNHTISNMHIGSKNAKDEITYADYKYAGLFGYVLSGSEKITIENVNIDKGSCIYTKNSNSGCAGAIAGTVITGGAAVTIKNCSSSADIYSSSACTGGICGGSVAYGAALSLVDCKNNGKVSSSSTSEGAYVGGICGGATAKAAALNIINCSNSASISSVAAYAGGICGGASSLGEKATLAISNCVNNSDVSSSDSYAGGVCGGNTAENGTMTISNCSNNGNISAVVYTGGICGGSSAKAKSTLTISNCSNSGNISYDETSKAYAGGICGAYAAEDDAKITISNTYYKKGCVGTSDKDGKFTSASTQKGIGTKDDVAGEVTALSDSQMKAAAGTKSGDSFKVNDKTYYALVDVLNDWVDANTGKDYLYWEISTNPVPVSKTRPSVKEDANKPSENEKKNSWVKDGDNWTYWKDGKQVTGWLQDGGEEWYYCDVNTGFMKTGWIQDGGSDWFYCNAGGVMEEGWFQDSDSTWYYFFTKEDATERGNREGAMAANHWVYSDDIWFYLGANGAFLYAE